MNQGKLEVVKPEMARVNVDILGISELKWTGMGEFTSFILTTYLLLNFNNIICFLNYLCFLWDNFSSMFIFFCTVWTSLPGS